jgi:solute carrier family 35 protein E3
MKTNKATTSASAPAPAITELVYLTFNFVSTIAVTFINKICFSRVQFGYPAALCNIHFMVTLVGVELLFRAKFFKKIQIQLTDPNVIIIILVVGLVTPLNNTSLKLNSIGFYQIFKLLVTPVVVALEYILDGKTLSKKRTSCLVAVCLFVLISSGADLNFSPYGTICASIWVPLAAAYKVQWGRVKRLYNNCSTLALMRAILPYAILVQAAISPLVDPPGLSQFVWTREAIIWIGLSGISAFMVNFSGFLVMGNISALAHVLLGQLKTAIVMIGAFFLFGSEYGTNQLLGAAGAVICIVLYTQFTMVENEKVLVTTETLPLVTVNDAARSNNFRPRTSANTPSPFRNKKLGQE